MLGPVNIQNMMRLNGAATCVRRTMLTPKPSPTVFPLVPQITQKRRDADSLCRCDAFFQTMDGRHHHGPYSPATGQSVPWCIADIISLGITFLSQYPR